MEGMIGEIRLFAGNFSPKNWTYCAGQLMAIAQNTALFSILGVTYGGDGKTTFGIPDLRGRVAMGQGTGPGLSPCDLGEKNGSTTAVMTTVNMPMHTHAVLGGGTVQISGGVSATVSVNTDAAQSTAVSPANNFIGFDNTGNALYNPAATANSLNSAAISIQTSGLEATLPAMQTSVNGQGQAFSIQQPYLGMSYIICVAGIFPARN